MWHGEFRDPRLVEVYDAECPWGWDDDFFMAVLAERTAPRVLDLGCGTGRLAIAMAATGHQVTGVDPARAALDAARRKPGAARVRWIEGSVETLPANSFDAAFLTSHVSQFIVGDEEWSAALHALRRALVTGGRLVFDSRDPASRHWEKWNPEDSRRSIVLDDGAVVTAWSEVTSAGADGVVSFTQHYRFSDGQHLTSSAAMRFRTEEDLRDSLWTAGFRVDRIYGGWGREPVGLSEDGELIVIANAEISPRS
ncbi:class I SAM-dependent methyltransferase [Actinoplanes aureus]|uniref:Class I SAM-dependent methyltransferase n=1 Tax=Actinoplanes aureus TaxID=2792083 RepID=A0A931C8Q5_9ACTN|nr:class I SAM-dependent methyltransferase [Actinoplanes aureus]MBG0563447.1 class I SAM-dependent methyltransferase [Actinoplanes aureus]